MGTATWNGSASNDWATPANWTPSGVPANGDDIVIPDTSLINECVLDQARNVNSFTLDAAGEFSQGNTLFVNGKDSSDWAVNCAGNITDVSDFTIATPSAANVKFVNADTGTGSFRSVVVNHASCVLSLGASTSAITSLTITEGTLASGGWTLEVSGKTTIGDASHSSEDQATLNCGNSAVYLGSGKTDDYAIQMLAGGTFAGGSGNHTTGAIRQNVANTKFTFTAATTTINSEYISEDRMLELTAGKVYNADGRITLSGAFTSCIQWTGPSGDTGPHTLRLNDASLTVKPRNTLYVEENLNIDAGTFNTQYDGSDKDLTVTGAIDITGTLTGNASAISAGGLRVNNTGIFNAPTSVGSCSITGELSSYAFRISGGGTLNNNTGTITFLNVNSRLMMNGTGNIYNLTLNHASCFIMLHSDGTTTIEGNLTITAGQLTTYMEGTTTSKDLTVTGTTSISGTLTCNDSDITLGTGKTDGWALSIGTTGTFTGGSGTHIIGSISTTAWGSPSITLSSGATTINSKYISNGYSINCAAGTTFAHGGGSVIMTYDGNTLIQYSGGTLAFNDLTYNAAARTLTLEGPISCAGYLKILAGTLDTKSAENNALTVEEYTQVSLSAAADSATLATNDSVCQFGASGYTSEYGLLVKQGGTVTCGTASAAWTASSIYMNGTYTTLTFTRGVCTVTSQVGSGLNNSLDLNGIVVHNSGTVTLTIAAATSLDINGSSGDLNNLIINHSSCVATLLTATNIDNDLTITAGELDTGADLALTVGGQAKISGGTLTCNASTILIGQTDLSPADGTLWGLYLNGGTFTGGSGTHTISSIFEGGGSTATLTSGDTTLNGFNTSAAAALKVTGGTFAQTAGKVIFNGFNQIAMHLQQSIQFHDVQWSYAAEMKIYNWGTSYVITVTGTLTVDSGSTFNLAHYAGGASADNSLLVTEGATIAGTLNCYGSGGGKAASFGSLTIAGIFNATSGTTTVSGDMVSNGTLTHNDGKFVFNEHLEVSGTSLTFYNVSAELGVTKTVDFMNDFTVENELDGNNQWRLKASSNTVTLTLGTTSSQGTLDTAAMTSYGFEWDSNTSNFVKIKGASSLKPAIIEGTNIDWDDVSGGLVSLEDCDFQGAIITGGGGVTLTLTGDCAFADVTVSSGDTLDLNGQRMESSGACSFSGVLKGANSQLYASTLEFDGEGEASLDSSVIVLDGSKPTSDWKPTSGAANNFGTFVYNGGSNSTVLNQEWDASSRPETEFIVASGIVDCAAKNQQLVGVRVATGGELDGGSAELTVAGDFTSTGGLIGKTGLNNNNIYNAQFPASADQNPIYGSGHNFTIEGWWKYNSFGYDVLARSANTGKWMFLNNTSIVQFVFQAFDGSTVTLDSPTWTSMGVGVGEWVHIAGVCEGTSQKLYINGKLVSEATKAVGVGNGSDMWAIGSNPNATAYVFPGENHMLRMWREARTATELRDNMFTTTPTDTNSKLTANINYVAGGSGGTVTDAAGNGNGALYKDDSGHSTTTDAAAWAAGGTLSWDGGSTPSAGTLNMTGAGTTPTLTCKSATKFFNVTVGSSGEVTLAGHPYIYGLLTVDSNGITDGAGAETIGIAGTSTPVVHASQDFSNVSQIHYQTGGSAITITPTTYAICRLTATTVGTLVGAFVGTTLQVDGSCSLTAQNTTIQTRGFNINGANVGIDITNTDVTLTDATPYGFTGVNSTTTFTAGPTTNLVGHASKSKFVSENHFEIVGNITNLDVINQELTVAGTVTNCTGDIIQWHHSQDFDQRLDTDTADDRDVRLGGPALDNANHLNN